MIAFFQVFHVLMIAFFRMPITNVHKIYFHTRYSAEVKVAETYKTVSLNLFNEIYKNRIDKSYIIHPKNLSVKDNGIICIPAYMTFCL